MHWIFYVMIAYASTGLFLFEWAYYKVRVVRNVDEARDSEYPAYRRLDAPQWSRWKFYLGAMTWMPMRMIGIVVIIFNQYLLVKIVTIGLDLSDGLPIKGWRESVLRSSFRFACTLLHLNCGMIVNTV